MNLRWDLDPLYTSFDSEEFKRDLKKVDLEIENIRNWTKANLTDTQEPVKKIEEYITLLNNFYDLFTRLSDFAGLTLSVEAKNEKAQQYDEILEKKLANLTEPDVSFQKSRQMRDPVQYL
jgi:oligoendopeptidase F